MLEKKQVDVHSQKDLQKFFFFSKEEKVKDNTQEQQRQDPVAWVDVKDEQADVKKPDAHVGEVQSIQCESSMDKVPTSSSPQSRSVLT